MRTLYLLCFLTILCTSVRAQNTSELPNVVIILADDVGPGDLSGYRRLTGGKVIVETPNLDQLMREGTAFTDAHSPNALCAPSRCAIMTGNNTYHSYAPWGVWGAYQPTPIKETDMTLGKLMRGAGYQTAFLGKWHLGGDYNRQGTEEIYRSKDRSKPEMDVDISRILNGPQQQGFDYSLTFPAGIQNVPYAVYENGSWLPLYPGSTLTAVGQETVKRFGFKLDKSDGLGDSNWNAFDMGPLLVNKAIEYINSIDSDRPFFMHYCSQAVHLPHTPAITLDGQEIRGTTPSNHLGMVKELDVQVGMIIKALKAKGEYENTIFLFTSDNGGLLVKPTIKAGHNSPDIYRGGKNQVFEGGHRVPFIVSWPGRVPAGALTDHLISGTDIMATLAKITGQPLAAHQAMDSYDFLSTITGAENPAPREYMMIQGGTDRKVIYRDGKYKLIMQAGRKEIDEIKPISLFDLDQNVEEKPSGDLVNQPAHRERVASMLARYKAIRSGKLRTSRPVNDG